MKIASAHFGAFKRFTDLTISDVPPEAKLVILAGPNGTGKSSVFDGFAQYQSMYVWGGWDDSYHAKFYADRPSMPGPQGRVDVSFHGSGPSVTDSESIRRAFYFRTAYRLESDFSVQGVSALPPILNTQTAPRMNAVDTAVSGNYHRLVMSGLAELFDGDRDRTLGQVRDELLAEVRTSMTNIFGDLVIENVTNPLQGGSFFFQKGDSHGFHFKNLSGGERAAFDLLLDLAVKREAYSDTIYCIDEPETHLNTAVQGLLLEELIALVPDNCQLWIASHSLGMLRAARDRSRARGDVAFLDFGGQNFDQPCVITPVALSRSFWQRTLRVALDDLADLVAPQQVVLVEGRPRWEGSSQGNAEFDASCLRKIFGNYYPDTEFLSIGSAEDVQGDTLKLQGSSRLLTPGVLVRRVIDRDDRSSAEVEYARSEGVAVLSRRDLESYLLDEEVLQAFCANCQRPDVGALVGPKIAELLRASQASGGAPDDMKRIAGDLYNWLKRELGLRQAGNNRNSFMRDTLAPLLSPPMRVYAELESDIFGVDRLQAAEE